MAHTPTPLPWTWDGDQLWHVGEDYESKSDPHSFTGICTYKRLRDSEILIANKALVERAVNSFEPMREALRDMLALYGTVRADLPVQKALAALALADKDGTE